MDQGRDNKLNDTDDTQQQVKKKVSESGQPKCICSCIHDRPCCWTFLVIIILAIICFDSFYENKLQIKNRSFPGQLSDGNFRQYLYKNDALINEYDKKVLAE